MQVWDTAGQERFRTITASYYRGSNGIIIVYDVTSRDSFDHVSYWIKEIDRLATPDVCKLLVGNKTDLTEKRVVTTEEGKALANQFGVAFLETSARDNSNVEEMFLQMAKAMQSEALKNGVAPGGETVPLKPSKKVENDKKCC